MVDVKFRFLYRPIVSVRFEFRFFNRPILFLGLKFRFLYRPIVSVRFEFRFFNRQILFLGFLSSDFCIVRLCRPVLSKKIAVQAFLGDDFNKTLLSFVPDFLKLLTCEHEPM